MHKLWSASIIFVFTMWQMSNIMFGVVWCHATWQIYGLAHLLPPSQQWRHACTRCVWFWQTVQCVRVLFNPLESAISFCVLPWAGAGSGWIHHVLKRESGVEAEHPQQVLWYGIVLLWVCKRVHLFYEDVHWQRRQHCWCGPWIQYGERSDIKLCWAWPHDLHGFVFPSDVTLFRELLNKSTGACGTVRKNRKGNPPDISGTAVKVKKGEYVVRQKDNLVAVRFNDRGDVMLLSTVHSGKLLDTHTRSWGEDQTVKKTEMVLEYNKHLNGVDTLDQNLNYYMFNRKTVKWWKCCATHLLHMAKVQAHTLHIKCSPRKLTQLDFTVELVRQLTNYAAIEEALQQPQRPLPAPQLQQPPVQAHPDQHDQVQDINPQPPWMPEDPQETTAGLPKRRRKVQVPDFERLSSAQFEIVLEQLPPSARTLTAICTPIGHYARSGIFIGQKRATSVANVKLLSTCTHTIPPSIPKWNTRGNSSGLWRWRTVTRSVTMHRNGLFLQSATTVFFLFLDCNILFLHGTIKRRHWWCWCHDVSLQDKEARAEGSV